MKEGDRGGGTIDGVMFLTPYASVTRILEEHDIRDGPIVVGVSGGVDSVCLAHILARVAAARGLTPHIVHVHHGIRGADADEDAAFVRALARDLHIPFTLRRIDIPRIAQRPGVSLEEAARQWRYAILGQEAHRLSARWIAVAHNADDQVETVLMHIVRGAGLAGLRGMRPLTWYGHLRLPLVPPEARPPSRDLWLLRPLLWTPRSAIEAYARKHHLAYRFDRSNLDTTYFRNRLRHHILPMLEQLNPQIRNALYALGEIAAADFQLLHPLSAAAWAATLVREYPHGLRFSLPHWRAQPLALRRALLRDAVMHLRRELRDIGFRQIEAARAFLEDRTTSAGSQHPLPAGLILQREYDTFWIGEADTPPTWDLPQVHEIELPGPGTYPLGGGWQLRLTVHPREDVGSAWRTNPDPWTAYFDADRLRYPLKIRPRRPGERMEPLGMAGKNVLVSEIMINAKVPRTARERWPLLVDATDRVLWIVGVRQGHAARITPQTKRIAIVHVERGHE